MLERKMLLSAPLVFAFATALAAPAFGQSFVGEWTATATTPGGAVSETVKVELERAGSAVGCSVLCPGAVNTQIVFADRNRPGGRLEGDEVHASFQARAGKNLAEQGKDPAEVAAMVVDAIRTDRFWIVTHPGWFDVMAARAAAMPDGRLVQGRGDDAAPSPTASR